MFHVLLTSLARAKKLLLSCTLDMISVKSSQSSTSSFSSRNMPWRPSMKAICFWITLQGEEGLLFKQHSQQKRSYSTKEDHIWKCSKGLTQGQKDMLAALAHAGHPYKNDGHKIQSPYFYTAKVHSKYQARIEQKSFIVIIISIYVYRTKQVDIFKKITKFTPLFFFNFIRKAFTSCVVISQ